MSLSSLGETVESILEFMVHMPELFPKLVDWLKWPEYRAAGVQGLDCPSSVRAMDSIVSEAPVDERRWYVELVLFPGSSVKSFTIGMHDTAMFGSPSGQMVLPCPYGDDEFSF